MIQKPITLVGAIRPKELAPRRESPLQYRMFFIWNDYTSVQQRRFFRSVDGELEGRYPSE